jgi:hypothetical protein
MPARWRVLGAPRLAELLLHTRSNASTQWALEVAPGDLMATLYMAQVLLELDAVANRNEADRLLLEVIEA